MLAIYAKCDQFTPRMRNRLKTTGMGLGLVRLLLDAGRNQDAGKTLSSLENGFQDLEKANKSSQKHRKAVQMKSVLSVHP